ncbi:hypothetical protein ES708_34526 [subsurface metagenome]
MQRLPTWKNTDGNTIIIKPKTKNSLNVTFISHANNKLIRREIVDNKESIDMSFIDSDDNFVYIVGYTSGGFPYGLTHEENEKIVSEDMDKID